MPDDQETADTKANVSENTTEKSEPQKETSEETETKEQTTDDSQTGKDYLGETQEPQEDTTDWKKRYSDSTREYQTIKQEADNYKQAMANLERLAQANPRILEEINAAQSAGLAQQPTNINNQIVQQQVNQALEPIKKIAEDLQSQDRQSKAQAFISFEKKNPDIFPTNATEQQKKQIRAQIGTVVNALTQSGVSFNDALNRAALTVNPDIAVRQGKNEAYVEMFGEDQAGFASQTSADTKKPKKKYTPGELKAAEKLGVKEAMLKE